MKYRSLAVLFAAMLALVACDSKNKKVDKPAELTDIKSPTVRVQKLWGASVGGGGKKLRLGLGLATSGNKLFAAGREPIGLMGFQLDQACVVLRGFSVAIRYVQLQCALLSRERVAGVEGDGRVQQRK